MRQRHTEAVDEATNLLISALVGREWSLPSLSVLHAIWTGGRVDPTETLVLKRKESSPWPVTSLTQLYTFRINISLLIK